MYARANQLVLLKIEAQTVDMLECECPAPKKRPLI